MRPKKPKRSISGAQRLLLEISNRPALNGGFKKLAEQQTEQCERLERVEAWQSKFDRRFGWIAGVIGTLTLSVLGRLIYDFITHVVH